MKRSVKKLIIWLLSIALVFGGCIIYVCDYYHADDDAILLLTENHSVEPFELSRGVLAFEPQNPSAGFIFYPGGKVEYTAYIPLMSALAEEGILCILIKMPCNLAVLDMNAAKEAFAEYLNDVSLDADQIYFVNQIVEYVIQNGMMKDMSVLQETPFTDRGSIVEIFTDLSLWLGIKRVRDRINANAAA